MADIGYLQIKVRELTENLTNIEKRGIIPPALCEEIYQSCNRVPIQNKIISYIENSV